ncbi:MAG TPA: phosphate ABC transporter permease PstA [Spirochaetales bacterium]|nr:phosphate ABC transporter permease PstA [Spirochaetales bacterium]HOT59008.1 phosphate ABC transporter permease PstA [Spirochaetales bacterium]HPD80109.1 phosphate ABC transporter permease PstA [Spirochaetales bacterium]HRV27532.1 phosphate ABC transporter permease PstA [Spirochaetia bacterium]
MSTIAKFDPALNVRHQKSKTWNVIFFIAIITSFLFLTALLFNILNDTFGFVIIEYETPPQSLTYENKHYTELSTQELRLFLEENLPGRRFRALEREKPFENRDKSELITIIEREILNPSIYKSYSLVASMFARKAIQQEFDEAPEGSVLMFRSWISRDMLLNPQSDNALETGIRTALLGSVFTVLIAIIFSIPLGIAASVWMEEYLNPKSKLNTILTLNIYNLAGVPSIIYGMLGLAVFVRFLEPITSGALFNAASDEVKNGRTILSAGLTLGILILPVIIVNTREAIRAVPGSLRHASIAVGATKLDTIFHHVLPACFDRILTGAIFAMARVLGETAPLIIIGASTFISQDPTSLFSKFTTLPIQIYQWTSRPQKEFHNLAAGAIVILMILMIILNGTAIVLRNRINARKEAYR